MRNWLLIIILTINYLHVTSQDDFYAAFDHLIGKTWKAEGNWGDGSQFKQEVFFEYGLDKKIIRAKSKGFTDQKQTKYGLRNYGIRMYDKSSETTRFWEYDIFGGVTEGQVKFVGKDILYNYEYGNSKLTDRWTYVNDSTYSFIVGIMEDGSFTQTFLSTTFKTIDQSVLTNTPDLKKHLVGSWKAPAWEGILEETWKIGEDGHLIQSSEYKEDGKVLYASTSKIEIVGDEYILFSVIKDNDPKIFRATSYSEGEIVFENTEYSNPNKVIYHLKNNGPFRRTISGIEQGKPTSYTFEFTSIKKN